MTARGLLSPPPRQLTSPLSGRTLLSRPPPRPPPLSVNLGRSRRITSRAPPPSARATRRAPCRARPPCPPQSRASSRARRPWRAQSRRRSCVGGASESPFVRGRTTVPLLVGVHPASRTPVPTPAPTATPTGPAAAPDAAPAAAAPAAVAALVTNGAASLPAREELATAPPAAFAVAPAAALPATPAAAPAAAPASANLGSSRV